MSDYSEIYDPDHDFDSVYTRATARVIAEKIRRSDRVLDLGCATGLMARELLSAVEGAEYCGLDHSEMYLERARSRGLPNCEFLHGNLDDLTLAAEKWTHVLLTNVLHEVDDPQALLKSASGLLADGGMLHVTLQNPNSVHRLAALDLGLISSLDTVSELGRRYATRRMLYQGDLIELIELAGLRVIDVRGVFLKPLPNVELQKLGRSSLDALEAVAYRFPENCAMNYVLAQAI